VITFHSKTSCPFFLFQFPGKNQFDCFCKTDTLITLSWDVCLSWKIGSVVSIYSLFLYIIRWCHFQYVHVYMFLRFVLNLLLQFCSNLDAMHLLYIALWKSSILRYIKWGCMRCKCVRKKAVYIAASASQNQRERWEIRNKPFQASWELMWWFYQSIKSLINEKNCDKVYCSHVLVVKLPMDFKTSCLWTETLHASP